MRTSTVIHWLYFQPYVYTNGVEQNFWFVDDFGNAYPAKFDNIHQLFRQRKWAD